MYVAGLFKKYEFYELKTGWKHSELPELLKGPCRPSNDPTTVKHLKSTKIFDHIDPKAGVETLSSKNQKVLVKFSAKG